MGQTKMTFISPPGDTAHSMMVVVWQLGLCIAGDDSSTSSFPLFIRAVLNTSERWKNCRVSTTATGLPASFRAMATRPSASTTGCNVAPKAWPTSSPPEHCHRRALRRGHSLAALQIPQASEKIPPRQCGAHDPRIRTGTLELESGLLPPYHGNQPDRSQSEHYRKKNRGYIPACFQCAFFATFAA